MCLQDENLVIRLRLRKRATGVLQVEEAGKEGWGEQQQQEEQQQEAGRSEGGKEGGEGGGGDRAKRPQGRQGTWGGARGRREGGGRPSKCSGGCRCGG